MAVFPIFFVGLYWIDGAAVAEEGSNRIPTHQQIITTSQNYENLLNPITDKSNDHYYNLFKQSLSFLNEPERSKVVKTLMFTKL